MGKSVRLGRFGSVALLGVSTSAVLVLSTALQATVIGLSKTGTLNRQRTHTLVSRRRLFTNAENPFGHGSLACLPGGSEPNNSGNRFGLPEPL